MYLQRITVKNVRCFEEDLTINVGAPSTSQGSWTLILGNNGTGKTTLLRSIAMGLCDETSASALLRELRGEFVRRDKPSAEIILELQGANEQESLAITTTITRTADGTEQISQKPTSRTPTPRAQIFACGYGARRAVLGSEQYERYVLLESLYSLFNYESSTLLNPEVYLLRQAKKPEFTSRFLRKLETILLLPEGSVMLDDSGFVIQGPWGKFVPVGAIGDGYASTLSWVCDMFGWSALSQGASFTGEVRGIVLIDELEQHLHPTWQRQLIRRLAEAFPKIQFLATTHSPLVVIGSASLTNEACQLVLLEQKGEAVSARAGLQPPRDRRADQVLTSYLFGLASTSSDEITADVARYAQLTGRNDVTDEERAERDRLGDKLTTTLGGEENQFQESVRQAVNKTIREMAVNALTLPGSPTDALDFEVRRRLAQLFGPPEDAA